jgi:hypothetical protein
VVEGWLGEFFDQVKSLVQKEVPHTLEVTTLAITLATSKIFLFTHLLNEDGEGQVEVLKHEKLGQVINKFIAMSSPNIQNLFTSFKH